METTNSINILELMSQSPYLSFFIICLIIWLIGYVFVSLPNMIIKNLNIRKHGYPPEHCDAYGNFPDDEDKDEFEC